METLANIQAEVRTHSTKIASLKRGEGTSQPRTDELTVQPRPHLEPNNTLYGKLIRIEFPKFSGDDVKDWVYRYWTVQTYQEAFKALLNRVDQPELVAASMFMGGLKPEVGNPMRMFQVTTLGETYRLAKMQEATNTILKPMYNTPLLPTPKQSTTTYVSKVVTTPIKSNSVGQSSGYVTKNRYAPGHKCSGQLHSIEVIYGDDFDNYIDGDDETYQDCMGDMVGVTDSPQITLNDLSGLNSYQTMRVRDRVAKKLGCRLAKTTPMQVSVANGQRTMRTSICHDLKWSLQNEVFTSDVMLLPLGGSEMTTSIERHEQHPLQLCQMKSVVSVSAEVEQVLTQFDEVFEVPKDLPPQRSHDHQIPLMPNIPPINVRPYRHPPNQKDAIEGMIKELMDSGVIKASQSPFSSPIMMVKKKNDTWRMCIDYRQLNKHTIKDKFPILVIEELIDELNGSAVFSKLDLSSGYHQIRMKEDDICKTAFRTHKGHYEFLVLPFGLTNASLTFQSLMNTIFKAFLRKFLTKCYFVVPHVEYLGHIISAQGVSTDPSKIEAMQKWPILSTLKQLRGFLGLTGYYRRFIKDYASISQPMVALTKKDAFKWNPSPELAYHKLKKAMVKALVLALPNFEQEFMVETDASGKGIGGIPVSSVSSGVWDKVKDSWKNDLDTQNLIKSLEHHNYKGNKYSWTGGILKKKEKVIVGNDPELRKELVWHFHDEAIGGHSSAHISMDFIEKLPTSHGKSPILVVVDRLRKYAHFIPLTHPFITSQVAQVFLDQVYKLHGLPESIVSDRDKVFLRNFWKALFAELKVKLKLSTAYHPQTDGQTEVVNRSLGCYLRCMCGEKPKEWVKWLPLAEFCKVEEVDRTLQAREEAIKVLKFHLKRLKLPSSIKIHPVFHILQLKKCHGKDHSMGVLSQLREDGLLENKPMAILERRLGKANNKPVIFVLIQWTNKPVEEATWEIYCDIITRFPGFNDVNEVVP
nr:reverse transcriptase [Tanacetum cinerariifolium]